MTARRWFQLSLKSLFLLVLLVATFFAGYTLATKQAEQERRQAEIEARRQAEEARLHGGSPDHLVTGSGGRSSAVGDFDGDGQTDILIKNQAGGLVLYRNLGAGKSNATGAAGPSGKD